MTKKSTSARQINMASMWRKKLSNIILITKYVSTVSFARIIIGAKSVALKALERKLSRLITSFANH